MGFGKNKNPQVNLRVNVSQMTRMNTNEYK